MATVARAHWKPPIQVVDQQSVARTLRALFSMKTSKLLKTVVVGTATLAAISAACAYGLNASLHADGVPAMAVASMHIDHALLQARHFMGAQAEAVSMAVAALAVMAVIVKRRGKSADA
jgi:hypothetical protein